MQLFKKVLIFSLLFTLSFFLFETVKAFENIGTAGYLIITKTDGGKVSTKTGGNYILVEFPPEAVTENTTFTITVKNRTDLTLSMYLRNIPLEKYVVGNYFYDLKATTSVREITTFEKDITIAFEYFDYQIENLDEEKIAINYWDSSGSEWVSLLSSVDVNNNRVEATTSHLTLFAILGEEPSEEVEEEPEEACVWAFDTANSNSSCKEYCGMWMFETASGSYETSEECEEARSNFISEEESGEPEEESDSEMTVEKLQEKIAEILSQIQALQSQLSEVAGESEYGGVPEGFTFNRNLAFGERSDDVKYLQVILKKEIGSPVYPEDVEATGYFGSITKEAVVSFQEKHSSDVLSPLGLTQGTGFLGQKTRSKLNALLGN